MALTPNEIVHKEFDTKFRGYDANQVNDFLDVVVAEFENLIQENTRLKSELGVAVEKNEYFAQIQESLNSSIVVAQEAADRLKQNARKEAELILLEAEREANNHVNEANVHAQNLLAESEELKTQGQAYRNNLEKLVRDQLDLLSGHEYSKLFGETKTMEDMELPGNRSTRSVSAQVDSLIRESDETNVSDLAAEQQSLAPESVEGYNGEESVEVPAEEVSFADTLTEVPTPAPIPAEPETEVETEPAVENEPMPDETVVVDQAELKEALEKADKSSYDAEIAKALNKKPSESVLGETIRIELPRD
ncbi:DivIVA domain-containing protein [Aerococcaceae bacterium DSM 111176]|nr:DivIVA domain-containing protein [Aerococcaceae bacterium DSM 111176]